MRPGVSQASFLSLSFPKDCPGFASHSRTVRMLFTIGFAAPYFLGFALLIFSLLDSFS
ncbi:hypothetical protein BYT27DRAFT_7187469 [Phlegmacium glaucopus]|nr:hypothetical protein BYT27DRAFT_7187458 [Phlegmacium glaucopus]KAF8809656.1 hypothetical protein BYT27DRAFT_7187469 [Phlegmacium glaucopus]